MKIWIALLLAVGIAHGKDRCGFTGINGFKKQLLRGSPVTEEIKARKATAQALVEKAKQRPNPLVETEYSNGDQFGVEVNTYSLKALHFIELGDKRGSRIRESIAQEGLLKGRLDLQNANFLIQGLMSYRRAQQVELQIEAVKEAIGTFKVIVGKLSKRKRLTPEERVSLSTLKLALGDYEGRLHELVHEKEGLIVDISYWSSCEKGEFEYSSIKYPKLPVYRIDREAGLAGLATKQVRLAQSELELQESKGYADLAVGPIVNFQEQGSQQNFSAGIGITFNAPVFHTNDGGKMVAARKLREKKLEAQNQYRLLRLKLEKELRVYNHSLESLGKMPQPEETSKKHGEIEHLFQRGVVSIPMVIEAHRQHIEYLRSWFGIENDLLSSLKEIYLLTENEDLIQRIFK